MGDVALEGYVRFCSMDDLEGARGPIVRAILAKKVGLFLGADGSIRALEMTCKHQGADLSTGAISNGAVTCPRHGWKYDLTTGKCLSHPIGLPLRFHDVEVVDGQVMVALRPIGL